MSNPDTHRNDPSTRFCPWCGTDTPLGLRADGMGGTALWCIACDCKGPTVRISGDFADADRAAIERWSQRRSIAPHVPADVQERLRRAARLQAFIEGSRPNPDATMQVRTGDLHALLRAAGMSLSI